jgi:hypothetical protein
MAKGLFRYHTDFWVEKVLPQYLKYKYCEWTKQNVVFIK